MKKLVLFLFIILLVAQQIMVMPGCANIIPPSGGPRDSLPPVLTKASPGDSTRNFSGNRIILSFNEFIELQNAQQTMIISPLPKNFPDVSSRLNTLTIKLKDSLETNTTYTFNFGNAIKDFTEGNVLKDFTYTFSTGSYIDSLELKGKVILAETGKIDTTLIAILHSSSNDSAVVKEKPRYFAKIDGKGNFIFKNLPPKTFYLYALKDDGGTRRYFDDKQLFAFAGKPVVISGNIDAMTLYAYSARPAASINTAAIPSINIGRTKKTNAAESRLRYQTSLTAGQHDLLKEFVMTFDEPLKVFDSSKIRLYTDSSFNPAGPYKFDKDSLLKNIILVHQWKENTQYHLIMDKEFAEDSIGKKLLKTDTLNFRTKKLTDYGSLKIKFKNLDTSLHPVLMIMAGETVYKSYPMTGPEIGLPLFPPGEYELRILYDLNRNGKWDPGEFFGKHKQPEIVKPVERKISVKPAFQNEFEITL